MKLREITLMINEDLDRLGLADRYTTEISKGDELYLVLDLKQKFHILKPESFLLWLEGQTLTPDLSRMFGRPD